jgi:hypothetical protein
VIVPTVHPDRITPHSEAFQAIVLHLLVAHPALQQSNTKWESISSRPERRAVFLDRDWVLNEAVVRQGKPYPPADAASMQILPGTEEALVRLKGRGYLLLVVTNQPDAQRDQRTGQDATVVDATQAREPQAGVFRLWSEDPGYC